MHSQILIPGTQVWSKSIHPALSALVDMMSRIWLRGEKLRVLGTEMKILLPIYWFIWGYYDKM